MNHVTIKDIARLLNISVSTVSRALNDKYDVKKATRDLVVETAKSMGFIPNPNAQRLISRKSNTIGVIVPEFINSYFPEVIKGIQKVLFEKNYQVIIMSSDEKVEMEKENLLTMKKSMVDGLIISLTCETTHTDQIRAMIEQGLPVVLFNRISNDDLPAPKVVFNDYRWAYAVTEHLIKNGASNIIHLSGPQHLTFAINRINGFKDAMLANGMIINKSSIIETGLLVQDGFKIIQCLINNKTLPDAIFAVNDPTAIGAIKCLKANGFKVPDDVAIAGFTECTFAELLDPPLTSVLQPACEIGKKAAELLLDLLAGNKAATGEVFSFEGKLNMRASSVKMMANL